MLRAGELLGALHTREVRFVVVGGLAAVFHGADYITTDLDLCYARTADNLDRLVEALGPLRPTLRGAPPDLPFRLDAATLRTGLNFTLVSDAGDVDLLGEVTGLGTYAHVLALAVPYAIFGRETWVLGLDGLIRAKEASGRPKDLLLLPELRRIRDAMGASGEEGG
jgi:hypothetical protein